MNQTEVAPWMNVFLHNADNVPCTEEHDIDFDHNLKIHIPLTKTTDAPLISIETFYNQNRIYYFDNLLLLCLLFNSFGSKFQGSTKVFLMGTN